MRIIRFNVLGPFTSIILISLFITSCKKEIKAPPIPEVQVIQVLQTKVPVYVDFVGQTYGYQDIPIRARVDGFLTGLYFTEGSWVKQGQLLYTIDTEPYKAKEAEQLSFVAEAQTMLAKAESDLNRIRPLAEINAVSQSDLDAAVAQYGAAKASLDAAEAELRYSRINLSYTSISSPIRGIIGRTEAKTGEYVGRPPNPIVLNTVSRIDTILVRFSITESDYLVLAKTGIEKDALKKEKAAATKENKDRIRLLLSDGSIYNYPGRIDFADRQIDPTTGTMLIQASFQNPDQLLRPGLFSRVRILMEVVDSGLVVPQRCIREFQGIYQVYAFNANDEIVVKQVKLGPKIGSMWMVMDGLKAGENIVFEGLNLVRPGQKVKMQKVEVPKEFMNF